MDFYENVLWIQGARRSARIGASVYPWHTLQRVRSARMKSDRRAIRRPHVHFGASDRRAMGSEHPIGARPDAPCIHFGASDRRAIIHIHDRCLHSAAPPLQCLANIMGPDPSLCFPEREAGIFTVCLPRHRRSFGTTFEAMASNYGSCHQTDNALENDAWTAISWSPQGTPST